MTDLTRDARLLRTFVMLADTLVDDYDVVDLLQTLVDACEEQLDASAAGILLADPRGSLELIVSTSDDGWLVEVMQLAADAGPCEVCFHTGAPVAVPSIASSGEEWAPFRDAAVHSGFAAADAIPLRLRDTVIGTLNLLRAEEGPMPEDQRAAAQALADVATIGILHERTARESQILSEQLQLALSSRVVIEQAKGVVSYINGVSIDEAFTLIRDYARRHRLPLREVAARLVSRELTIDGGPTSR